MSDEPIALAVIKGEREEADRTYSKKQLLEWVNDLPDDITGWIATATRHLDDGQVWTRSNGCGNTVAGRHEAQMIGVIEFMQYKGKES